MVNGDSRYDISKTRGITNALPALKYNISCIKTEMAFYTSPAFSQAQVISYFALPWSVKKEKPTKQRSI